MNIKSINIFFWLGLTGCVTVWDSNDVERHFNSQIGTEYRPPMYDWNLIHENETSFDIEYINNNGCSYAFTIDKNRKIKTSWRFTSPRKKCDNFYIHGA